MVPQEKVDAHVNSVERLVLGFERRVASEVDVVAADVSAHVLDTLRVHGGVVKQSRENVVKVLAIEDVFQESLDSSEYYPTILAFVESFVGQLGDFDSLHGGISPSTSAMTGEDRGVLSNQAAVAVAVMESHQAQVLGELRQYLSRSSGEIEVGSLVSGACAVVRKLSQVGPIGKDQCNLWYRLLSSLVYRRVEMRGTKLTYTYAGPGVKKSTRDFCSKLLSGSPLTLGEVSELDNGQTQDALLNGGGFGCSHFWFGEPQGNPL